MTFLRISVVLFFLPHWCFAALVEGLLVMVTWVIAAPRAASVDLIDVPLSFHLVDINRILGL